MKVHLIVFVVLTACLVKNPNDPIVPDVPTYFKDVKPLFAEHCAQCHFTSPTNWLKYEDAFAKQKQIKLRVLNRSMPANARLRIWEIELIKRWVENGAQP